MNIIIGNETQNMEMDSYGMYYNEYNSISACDPVASCDTNFDN